MGHRQGLIGDAQKAALRYLVWKVEMSIRKRKFPIDRTRDRLMANLEHSTLDANVQERQRRAAKVTSWILHGAVATYEICEKVVKYEARGRPASELFALCARHCARYRELLEQYNGIDEVFLDEVSVWASWRRRQRG